MAAIYDQIHDTLLADGSLPEDFSLPQLTAGSYKFYVGEFDGLCLYHYDPEHQPISFLKKALEQAAAGNFAEAEEGLAKAFVQDELGRPKTRMIMAYEDVQKWAGKHTDSLQTEAMEGFLAQLLLHTEDLSSLKLALVLLPVLAPAVAAGHKEELLTIGSCDEFTYYVLLLVQKLYGDEANDLIFQLAKRTHGWGRIHAVKMLEASTDAIRRWLLLEGCHNTVNPNYSALVIANKIGLAGLLEGELSAEDFAAAGYILKALAEEDPLVGLSGYEDGDGLVETYVKKAKKYSGDSGIKKLVKEIKEILE